MSLRQCWGSTKMLLRLLRAALTFGCSFAATWLLFGKYHSNVSFQGNNIGDAYINQTCKVPSFFFFLICFIEFNCISTVLFHLFLLKLYRQSLSFQLVYRARYRDIFSTKLVYFSKNEVDGFLSLRRKKESTEKNIFDKAGLWQKNNKKTVTSKASTVMGLFQQAIL